MENSKFYRNMMISGALIVIALAINLAMTPEQVKKMHRVVKPVPKYIPKIDSTFSQDALVDYVYSLNVRFPHIILAQAHLESGKFTSGVFRSNNNLFGMRQARLRPTTNKGSKRGYAVYSHWRDSVMDYILYYAVYMHKYKTEEAYYNYLDRTYAENPNYSKLLRKIAESYKKL
jgi:uncharacterized FlgJ-related protein